jgi:hypothetical protein
MKKLVSVSVRFNWVTKLSKVIFCLLVVRVIQEKYVLSKVSQE